MVKKVLRSAEKFSESFPLSPLPLYPSPTYCDCNRSGHLLLLSLSQSGGRVRVMPLRLLERADVLARSTPRLQLTRLLTNHAWSTGPSTCSPAFSTELVSQENPHAHKSNIGTSPPQKKTQNTPPKTRIFIWRMPPCAVKRCAVRPVFAPVVGELRAANSSKCPRAHEAKC